MQRVKQIGSKDKGAYRSLKTNMPWLFTWYDNMGLKIPNTTNSIDGPFY